MEKNKLLLIDTFNFLHRAYHALPKTLTDSEGSPTNAVYGVTSMLISAFEAIKPTHVIAAMDSVEPTFRVEDFTGYKAHRRPMEDDLSVQIPKVIEVIDAFGIKRIELKGYEADDVIGTVAKKFGHGDTEIVVVSNDRDLWQLVNDNVTIMVPVNGGGIDWIGPNEVVKRLGFAPAQLIDYKALRGDTSDNIPGVFGIGEKTAKTLIEKYTTLEEIYKHISEITPQSVQDKLANNAETAVMSKKLATIVTDAPLDLAMKDCKYKEYNKANVVDVLKKYRFKSLIRRLGFDEVSAKTVEVADNQMSLL